MDTEIEVLCASGPTSSHRSRALRSCLVAFAVAFLLFLDGCAENAPKPPTAIGPSDPPITGIDSQQAGGSVEKELGPSPKSVPGPARPRSTLKKPPLSSPKAAESVATAPTTPATIAAARGNPAANQPAAPEPPTVHDTIAAPPEARGALIPEAHNALIFKGAPRTTVPKRSFGHRAVLWLVCFSVIALSVGIAFVIRRHGKGNAFLNPNNDQPAVSGKLALEGASRPPEALGE